MEKQAHQGVKPGFKVIVVDDHPLVRSALVQLVEKAPNLEVTGEWDGTPATHADILGADSHLVLLDINLKGADGLDLLRRIKETRPATKVLVISMHEDPAYVNAAMRSGASGYILKTNETDLIPIAIQTILKGGIFLGGPVTALFEESEEQKNALTARETEVIRGVVQGLGARQIGERLQISHRTVEVHRAHAMKKLNARNSAELTRIAIERGITAPLPEPAES